MNSFRFLRFFLFLSLIALVSCKKNGKIQPDESGLFMKFFGGAKDDVAFAAEESGDGGYLIVGATSSMGNGGKDMLVIKTDAYGNTIRKVTFGGSKNDEARDVIVTSSGDYLILGYATNAKDSTDFVLIRTDKNLNLLDSMTFGSPNKNEQGHFIKELEDNNFILAGNVVSNNNITTDMFIVKTNLSHVIWQRTYGLIDELDEIGSIQETADNHLVLCGTVRRGADTDMRVVKADAFGNLLWDYSFGYGNGKDDRGEDIKVVPGGFIVVGSTKDTEDGNSDIYMVKLSEEGILSWESKIGGAGNQTGNSLYVMENGGFIVTGAMETNQGTSNVYLVKTDQQGNVAWENNYGGEGNDVGKFVKQTSDRGFLILGTTTIVNNTILHLIKTNSEGGLYNGKK